MQKPSSEQDRMDQLLVELSQLRDGQTLTKPSGWLENIDMSSVGVEAGCSVKFGEILSRDPIVRGVVFTREDI
jgi:hypothetical protein